MLPGREVLISFSPTTLCVAVPGSAGLAMDRTPLDPADWERCWQQGLLPLDKALEAGLARLQVGARARITVVYHGPDVHADVFTLPGAPGDALRAAGLALAEAFPGGLRNNPSAVTVLARDGAGAAARCHVLGVADRDEQVQAVYDWIRRAGCTVNAAVPAKAIALADAVARAGRMEAPGGGGLLLLDEHATVIVGVADQAVRVARLLGFGHDLLTDAVRRAARTVGPDHGPVWRAAIGDGLLRSGIPGRAAAFPAVEGLTGAAILPLAQPVIQRLAVEVKQTLRFALNFSELSRVKIVLAGSGSRIPGLAASLSEMLDAQVDIAGGRAANAGSGAPPGPDLETLIRHRRPHLGLEPDAERRQSEVARASAGVRIGALSTAALLGGLFLSAYTAERRMTRSSAELAPALAQVHERRQLAAQAEQLEGVLNAEVELLNRALSPGVDWSAVMAELSEAGTASVRLTGIYGTAGVSGASLTVQGIALADSSPAGVDPLGGYVEQLTGSPLIAGVEMGPTRAAEFNGGPAKVFSLTLKLHALPDRGMIAADARPGGAQ